MNLENAIRAMMEGKKIRNTEWHRDCFVYFDRERDTIVDETGEVNMGELLANFSFAKGSEWMICEEKITIQKSDLEAFYFRMKPVANPKILAEEQFNFLKNWMQEIS